MASEPIVLLWSGGKDAALTLDRLWESADWSVAALLTTVAQDVDRVPMHGVSRALIARQAAMLRLPLYGMHIPSGAPNEVYEERLRTSLAPIKREGIRTIACGDVHLEDVRAWREQLHVRLGFTTHFPLWGQEPFDLAEDFLQKGFQAVITSVNTACLDKRMTGRPYDKTFLGELPESVDPCGEGGEFHTFVFDGPHFREPVRYRPGMGFSDDRMWILPLDSPTKKAPPTSSRQGL